MRQRFASPQANLPVKTTRKLATMARLFPRARNETNSQSKMPSHSWVDSWKSNEQQVKSRSTFNEGALLEALREAQEKWRQKYDECASLQNVINSLTQAVRESDERLYEKSLEVEQLQLKLQGLTYIDYVPEVVEEEETPIAVEEVADTGIRIETTTRRKSKKSSRSRSRSTSRSRKEAKADGIVDVLNSAKKNKSKRTQDRISVMQMIKMSKKGKPVKKKKESKSKSKRKETSKSKAKHRKSTQDSVVDPPPPPTAIQAASSSSLEPTPGVTRGDDETMMYPAADVETSVREGTPNALPHSEAFAVAPRFSTIDSSRKESASPPGKPSTPKAHSPTTVVTSITPESFATQAGPSMTADRWNSFFEV